MQEMWKVIDEVPNYEVSSFGYVRRIGNILPMVSKTANGGTKFVTMSHNGERYTRSIKLMVANAFVPHPSNEDPNIFDTPIQCSISTENNRADNIMWRPRWFAIQFRRQLHPNTLPYYHDIPVINLHTGNKHASILTAALHDGVLMKAIYRSAGEGNIGVFPTGHKYEFVFRLEKGFGTVHDMGV